MLSVIFFNFLFFNLSFNSRFFNCAILFVGEDGHKVVVYGTTGLATAITIGISALFLFMDLFLRPESLRKYKVQLATNEPVEFMKVLKVKLDFRLELGHETNSQRHSCMSFDQFVYFRNSVELICKRHQHNSLPSRSFRPCR